MHVKDLTIHVSVRWTAETGKYPLDCAVGQASAEWLSEQISVAYRELSARKDTLRKVKPKTVYRFYLTYRSVLPLQF